MSLRDGTVLFKGPTRVRATHRCRATISTMGSLSPPIIPGSSFEMYMHGEEVIANS